MDERVARWVGAPWAGVVLLVLLCVVGYAHTLDVPFYFDDYSSIVENPVVISGDPAAVWQSPAYRARFFGYLTFMVNHELGGFSPAGYHVVNIVIHLIAGIALFLLVRGLALAAGGAGDGAVERRAAFVALLAAVLFIVHPLQTQAVTYVVQRLASMAAAFYLLTLLFYLYGRRASAGGVRVAWFVAALGAAVVALFTKQNTFTLPLALLLVEWVGFGMTWRKARFVAAAGVVTGLLLAVVLWVVYGITPFSIVNINAVTGDWATEGLGRVDYLLLQLEGLVRYVALYLAPVGLRLDYAPPTLPVVAGVGHLLLAALHLALIGLGLFLLRRAPLIAFGILFFYMAHLVESSIIPITDVFVEHRMYLPGVGLAVVVADLVYRAVRLNARPALFAAVGGVVLLLAMTWARNGEWRDPLHFWERNAQLSPTHYRPWSVVARHYLDADRPNDALMALERASDAKNGGKPGPIRLDEAAVVTFSVALMRVGRMDDAELVIEQTLAAGGVNPLNQSKLLTNKGNIQRRRGDSAAAEASYRRAVALFPANHVPWNNLVALLVERDAGKEAAAELRRALELNPSSELLRQAERALQRGG